MPVRALLFDLDNTLVPEFPNYERAFDAACIAAAERYSFDLPAFRQHVFARSLALWEASETSAFCADLGIGSPTSLLSDFPGERPEFRRLRDWAPAYRRRCWTETLGPRVPRSDVDELADDLDRAFRAEVRANCPPYNDVPKIVEALASRYTVAVLTNGPIDVQLAKLGASGLKRHIPTVVASGEAGFGKPDPRLFALALQRLGVTTDDAVAIGDSIERDLLGARNAGLRSIWVNRRGEAAPPDLRPAIEIQTLTELPQALTSL